MHDVSGGCGISSCVNELEPEKPLLLLRSVVEGAQV